jgi:hypothetical protein
MKAPTVKRQKKQAEVKAPVKRVKPTKNLALKPRVSEKAYGLSENSNVYVFDTEFNANKFDVAKAVASQYDVTVTKPAF